MKDFTHEETVNQLYIGRVPFHRTGMGWTRLICSGNTQQFWSRLPCCGIFPCKSSLVSVGQKSKTPFTRYNRLSNRMNNRLDVGLHESNRLNSYNRLNKRLNVCIHDATGCQPRCQTGLTTSLMLCIQTLNRLFHLLFNRLTTGCIV